MRDTSIGCFSHTPNWGSSLQPRLGIKLATFRFAGQHSVYWATPARAKMSALKDNFRFHLFLLYLLLKKKKKQQLKRKIHYTELINFKSILVSPKQLNEIMAQFCPSHKNKNYYWTLDFPKTSNIPFTLLTIVDK